MAQSASQKLERDAATLAGIATRWPCVPPALPIFLQEMVLAVWLIAKGFRPSAARSDDLSATKPAIPALDDHKPDAA